jgi:hypothetical protein
MKFSSFLNSYLSILVLLSLLFEIHSQNIASEGKEKSKKNESLIKKLQKEKNSLKSIHANKDKKSFKKLVDDVLSNEDIDSLKKERTTEDTKAILGYMMSSLYNKMQKNKDFEIEKYFDEVSDLF